jgi:DNA-binding HxlR family transcriptional regulator
MRKNRWLKLRPRFLPLYHTETAHRREQTMGNVLSPKVQENENSYDPSGKLKRLNVECRNCAPTSPLECITRCRVYQLKNELRHLWGAMENPNYMKELFNVLKNETRLCILQAIVNNRCSVNQLQQELNKTERHYGQGALSEYLRPLISVGLATIVRDEYRATTFGARLTHNLGTFSKFTATLPAHSECYEETILCALLSGPKTFQDIEVIIDPKIVSRTLKRLRSTRLIRTPRERDYIFFFRTKRNADKETLAANERKIYDAVACEGISAGSLAKETGLSSRVTYKHLRRLRGKKLVFIRKTPKTYRLTCKGQKLASALQKIQQTVEDTWNSSQPVMQDNKIILEAGGLTNGRFHY